MDNQDCRDVDLVRVRRAKQTRKSAVQYEVAVVFIDKHVRDLVASHRRNLAVFTDEKGLPTAGLRLEYPSVLGKVFRDLDWYGREMRSKHSKGTRRNIKFDDTEETMYIYIRLPNETFWHRISHQEAACYRDKIIVERARQSWISLENGPVGMNRISGLNGLIGAIQKLNLVSAADPGTTTMAY